MTQTTDAAARASVEDVVVEISDGKLKGRRSGAILAFKGVPYGGPTGGVHRFAPPPRVQKWAGVRDALAYGPAAPQINIPGGAQDTRSLLGWGDNSGQSEDCLVLNVWTPALDNGARPVLFRIHGGGYSIGSGSWPQSDGAALALMGDVVVVTVNHRLGALGYLYLAEIGGARYADSGNAGMLDLVAALQWVRDNIAAFGGDPQNVMIFGKSGGGSKVSTLLAMPPAAGLFHKAVVESGPGLHGRSAAAATATTRKMLDQLGIGDTDLDKLHELSFKRLVLPAFGLGGPVVDGRALPAPPGEAMASGASADIPLMIGYNRTEGTLLSHMAELPALATLDEAGMRSRLVPIVKEGKLDDVLAGYKRAYPNASPGDLFLYIESVYLFGANTMTMAERKVQGATAPVYVYRFDWRGQALNGLLNAAHGLEVPFTMRNPHVATALSQTPSSAALVDRMSAVWAAFARSGNPNALPLPNWTPYTPDRHDIMLFDDTCTVTDALSAERAVWGDLKPQIF